MSKDIRSYFAKKEQNCSTETKATGSKNSKKRIRRILDSDEEDDDCTPAKLQTKTLKTYEKPGTYKTENQSEVVIKVENFFGHTPVQQKKQKLASPKTVDKTEKIKKSLKTKKESSPTNHDSSLFEPDDELDASLLNTDDELLIKSATSTKSRTKKSDERSPAAKKKKVTLDTNLTLPKGSVTCADVSNETLGNKKKTWDEKITSPSNNQKKKNLDAYHRFLHRPGPKNPGTKEIPQGSPSCLQGLVFVITGILDSLEREEAVELIQKCGGRVTTQVSKKTNYVIVGQEPGESKIQKALAFGTKKINEDELFDLIIQKSDANYEKTNNLNKEPPKSNLHSTEINGKSPSLSFKKDIGIDIHGSSSQLSKKENERIIKSELLNKNDKFELETDVQEEVLWVEKYKPKSTKNIIGQNGDKSSLKKLIFWLQNWHKNHSGKIEKKHSRPAPWVQNDNGSYFKAALLSGPPGVGKTTSVHLACQELDLDKIEFNASDTRSKRLLQEEVSELLSTKSLKVFMQENKKPCNNQVLVMDEVDGMAGNEDRGGMQELIQLIKNTKIPIIGICNDRNHQKIKSLVNYCFDLRFQRPPLKQIKAAMMSICFKENINISGEALEELIISSNHDLRQVLHKLSLLSFVDKSLTFEEAKKNGFDAKKPLNLGPWDVVRRVFSASDQEKMGLNDKIDLFFQDYSLGPLFVQDAYLHVKPHKAFNSELKTLEFISEAAESIALGDTVDKVIRNQNSWNLLPVQAIFASVLPGHVMTGHFMGKIEFPAWFGKNSKTRKTIRIVQELYSALSTCITGDDSALILDYVQNLRDCIIRPLIMKGIDGVQESVKFMVDYGLLRENLDHIMELSSWPDFKDQFSNIETKVKAAFTRALNKECQKASCAMKKVVKTVNETSGNEDDGEDDLPFEEIGDVNSDPMIKKGKMKHSSKNESAAQKGKNRKKEGTKK